MECRTSLGTIGWRGKYKASGDRHGTLFGASVGSAIETWISIFMPRCASSWRARRSVSSRVLAWNLAGPVSWFLVGRLRQSPRWHRVHSACPHVCHHFSRYVTHRTASHLDCLQVLEETSQIHVCYMGTRSVRRGTRRHQFPPASIPAQSRSDTEYHVAPGKFRTVRRSDISL